MSRAKLFFAEPRQRLIALLGVAAVAGVLVAGIAVHLQNSGPVNDSPQIFPGLSEELRQVVKIRIQSRDENFDVVFNPQKGWILPSRGDYPASREQIRQTLVGLASLEIIEQKTSRKEWLGYLGLDEPSKGMGVAITVFGDGDKKFASLILGKTSDIGDKTGAIGLFVRKPDSNESWLARSTFVPHTKPVEWMDKNILKIAQDRIRSVDIEPQGFPPFSLARTSKDQDFAVTPIASGRQAVSQTIFGIADALADFPFDNILPATEIDFAKAERMVFRTFDGLMVTISTTKRGAEYWASLEASAVPGMHHAEKEMRSISAHTNGWAYKLPSYKGEQFMPTLESVLSPRTAPK